VAKRKARTRARTIAKATRKKPKSAKKTAKTKSKAKGAANSPLGPLLGSDGIVVPRSKMTDEMKLVERFIAEIVTKLQTGEPVSQTLIDSLPKGVRVELPIEAAYSDGSASIGTVTIEDGHVTYHRLHDTLAPPDETRH
jgi:hypothetical protein